jgi:hypothetical protein
MILKRLSVAIAEQNWFTVFLEILIVVVAIFLGLQVDDWNSVRKERVRETDYLQRIDAELAEDIAEFEAGITTANRRIGYARLVLAVLADPTLATGAPTEFVNALVRAGFTYSPVVSDNTFEEIKSTGELGIIRDVALRTSVTKYYQQIRQYSQWGYLREMNQTEYLKRQAGILTPTQFEAFWVSRLGMEVTSEEAKAVLEKLASKPALAEWLPVTIAFLAQDGDYSRKSKESAENLRKKIAEFLAKDSADRTSY